MLHAYHRDAYQQVLKARVESCEPAADGRFAVVLDDTVLFPEGGGQPSDGGSINGVRCVCVCSLVLF